MKPSDPLHDRLDRLSAALGTLPSEPVVAPGAKPRTSARLAGAGTALALGLVAVAIATGSWGWVVAAVLVGVVSAAAVLSDVLSRAAGPRDPSRPHIGMGAEIAADAVIEPGASVEMGATVRAGAVIKRGAVVRMGADVREGAVVEEGAVVSWGADVKANAVVERDAVVGAGATVHENARVPSGMHLSPGADWSAARGGSRAPATPADPRKARIDAACDRLQNELAQASPQLREALGVSDQTVTALRKTSHGVLGRERALRAEAAPEAFAQLERERAELTHKIAAASDDAVRRSLQSAVKAIDDQQRQRDSLRRSADRLDAEVTRLQFTLEGMGTQLVRLRTAGFEAAAPTTDVVGSLNQLYDEIDAIAEGLEAVSRGELARDGRLADLLGDHALSGTAASASGPSVDPPGARVGEPTGAQPAGTSPARCGPRSPADSTR